MSTLLRKSCLKNATLSSGKHGGSKITKVLIPGGDYGFLGCGRQPASLSCLSFVLPVAVVTSGLISVDSRFFPVAKNIMGIFPKILQLQFSCNTMSKDPSSHASRKTQRWRRPIVPIQYPATIVETRDAVMLCCFGRRSKWQNSGVP